MLIIQTGTVFQRSLLFWGNKRKNISCPEEEPCRDKNTEYRHKGTISNSIILAYVLSCTKYHGVYVSARDLPSFLHQLVKCRKGNNTRLSSSYLLPTSLRKGRKHCIKIYDGLSKIKSVSALGFQRLAKDVGAHHFEALCR